MSTILDYLYFSFLITTLFIYSIDLNELNRKFKNNRHDEFAKFLSDLKNLDLIFIFIKIMSCTLLISLVFDYFICYFLTCLVKTDKCNNKLFWLIFFPKFFSSLFLNLPREILIFIGFSSVMSILSNVGINFLNTKILISLILNLVIQFIFTFFLICFLIIILKEKPFKMNIRSIFLIISIFIIVLLLITTISLNIILLTK